ncbi:hypothetical protein DFH09DRAFT_1076009 [Mycena vulgaris]|nr:hypothetical protein DFH09DRAFT_1076009 [Mycena vulgaris]
MAPPAIDVRFSQVEPFLLVTSAIAIDTVSMVSNYAAVYLYTITHWVRFLRRFGVSAEPVLGKSFRSYWKKHNRTHVIAQPEPFYIYTTGIVAAMAQGFLTTRYLLLTKNKFITLILFFFITVAIGGAFGTATTLAIFPRYKDRGKVVIPATIWLVAEAVADISIALALLVQFRKVKSPFKETRRFLANNQSNSGFLGLPHSIPGSHIQVPTGIAYCLGRIYCITMLVVLNRRKTGKTRPGGGTSSGGNPETRGEHGNQQRSECGDEYGGIHPSLILPLKPGQGLPDDSPGVEIEMTVIDAALYSSKKQDLFAPCLWGDRDSSEGNELERAEHVKREGGGGRESGVEWKTGGKAFWGGKSAEGGYARERGAHIGVVDLGPEYTKEERDMHRWKGVRPMVFKESRVCVRTNCVDCGCTMRRRREKPAQEN